MVSTTVYNDDDLDDADCDLGLVEGEVWMLCAVFCWPSAFWSQS